MLMVSRSHGAGSLAALIRQLAAEQDGVVSRRQLLAAGMSPSAIARRARTGWQVLYPGVYYVDTGQPSAMARVWAAWLYADSALWRNGEPSDGEEAAASSVGRRVDRSTGVVAAVAGECALWLAGVVDECPDVIEIAVPRSRHLARRSGIRVLRREGLPVRSARRPPRLEVDEALLDVVHRARRAEGVVGLVLAAGQRRLTTPQRVLAAVDRRPRLRWRSLVRELCDELENGVHSPLERRYAQLERRHGLPTGERNLREAAPVTGSWFRDVRYRAQRLVVELDGRGAHPVKDAFRDRRRDNHAARLGETTLRYGWREVVASPCEVAAEVAHVLTLGGWTGQPRPCGPTCAVGRKERGGSVPLSGSDPPRSRHAG
jgi:very-short-patch-repair endonuclease